MTNKTTAQIVNEQVGKEMKELEARLVAAGYGNSSGPKTVTFAVPNELHDLIADACNRPSFSIGCKLDGTDIVQFSPLTGNVVKRSEKHVSVEDYNTLQACIEKESYADGDDEFDKACVQVSETVRLKELEAEIAKLQQEQDSRQKETDNLVLELRQYVERYRNANTRAIAAEMKFAEFVRQGVLKMTPNGHEPVLTREYIDETVFMCKIRANRMAEALHKYKYQKKNAYASEKDREDAETDYMNALQLFNDTFAYL